MSKSQEQKLWRAASVMLGILTIAVGYEILFGTATNLLYASLIACPLAGWVALSESKK